MTPFQNILEDLRRTRSTEPSSLRPPYDDRMSFEEKFNITRNAADRSKRTANRTLQLVNLFYLGQLLERDAADNTQRSYFAQKLSLHYRTIAVRLYYIFEAFGVEQIAQSTRTTPSCLRSLSQDEYQDLVMKSLEIFNGVEN